MASEDIKIFNEGLKDWGKPIKATERNCFNCQYYIGDNKCNIFPWDKNHYVYVENPKEKLHCVNFEWKNPCCCICGKPLNPHKMLMIGETVSGKTALRKLYGKEASVETCINPPLVSEPTIYIHCLNCLPKNYDWGEKETEEPEESCLFGEFRVAFFHTT